MDLSFASWPAVPAEASEVQADVTFVISWQLVRKRREQSGTPGPGVQAERPRAAREKPLSGPGLPGGRVVQRGRQQLPERAEVYPQDAV